MTSMITKSALLGGAVSIALAGLAFAAPAAAPADPAKVEKRVMIFRDGPGGPGGPGGMKRFHHRGDPARHAQHLRDVLQLTPAQEPALQAYIEATKPEVKWEHREHPKPDAAKPETPRAPLTTPERLDRQADMMARRQTAFAKRSAAIKTFYAQLTAPQKKAFDALGIDGGGRGMHGRDVRVIRRAAGDAPMVFGPDGAEIEMALGALEDFEIEFDMPDMPDMPEMPDAPEAPGA